MRTRLLMIFLAMTMVGCGAPPGLDPGTEAPTVTKPEAVTRLRVFQDQVSCCYMEGQISFLAVDGAEHEINPTRIGLVPLIALDVEPGEHLVESWQRPCSGNCGFLDPPANQCSLTVQVAEGSTTRLLGSFEPGSDPCGLTVLDDDPETTVPAAYGFREPLPFCGEDFTMQMAMFGEPDLESVERRCFVDAHQAGEPAELAAYVPPDPDTTTDDILDLYTYRTQPGRPVEVFRNVGPEFEKWLTYECATLTETSGPELFTLDGCDAPASLG